MRQLRLAHFLMQINKPYTKKGEKEMLKINGNVLSAEGIQFRLPDNFYIDTEGMEYVAKNGLRLVSPEKDFAIMVRTDEDCFATTMEAMLDTFSDSILESGSAIELYDNPEDLNHTWVIKPEPYSYNGLTGVHTLYATRVRCTYYLIFDVAPGSNERFVIYIESGGTKNNFERIMTHPGVKAFLESFTAV